MAARRVPIEGVNWLGSLSIFLPGAGQLLRQQVQTGLLFLTGFVFAVTLGWALILLMDRVVGTLELFDLPREAGVWALGALYGVVAMVHLGSVLFAAASEVPRAARRRPHPVVASIASAIVPGWGQVLNGDCGRALVFVVGLWIAGAAWLLVLPQFAGFLDTHRMFLPEVVVQACGTVVRWTLPAVIWSLAVYDAYMRAES